MNAQHDSQPNAQPHSGAASVGVEDLHKAYGRVRAVNGVSLAVPSGGFLALLGPSGSGKTTILMAIAGFEQPDRGRVLLGDRDITALTPHRRGIGMVFQRYALFPHMTVAENIAYPLRQRGVSRVQRDGQVRDALDLVRLQALGGRLPSQLSGGQQQRVALARALVYRPPVLLMDEPLGALDRKLREELQVEIKQLQRRLGITVVFVTHDQQEALSMADQVALLRQGRIAQVGTPRDLHDSPASPYVADFIGEATRLTGVGRVDREGGAVLRLASGQTVHGTAAGGAGPGRDFPAELVIRPVHVTLTPQGVPGALLGQVIETVYAGETIAVLVDLGHGQIITARRPAAERAWQVGDQVAVAWPMAQARIFPADADADQDVDADRPGNL